MKDMDGWRIHPGRSRVFVPRRDSHLLGAGWLDSEKRKALPEIGGLVVRAYISAKGEECIELIDFETRGRRNVKAGACRVMAGETQGSIAFARDRAAKAKTGPGSRKRGVNRKV